MSNKFFISAGLAAAIGLVYHPVFHFSFVSFDDLQLIVKNPLVRGGLTWPGVKWAFGFAWQEHLFFYPLSLISHMLDCHIFGLQAGGHHLTSVILHLAAVLFFFFFLEKLTGCRWRAALTAGLFAIHPLAVESVAWVAERSNVLCAALTGLCLYAYAGYAQNFRKRWYVLALAAFVFALLAKPTAIMLPVLLILLDWLVPNRHSADSNGRKRSWKLQFVEKVPFLVLAGIRMTALLAAEKGASPVMPSAGIDGQLVLLNFINSLVLYLGKVVYPAGLAVYYPFPESIPWWQPVGATMLLGALMVVLICLRRKNPLLLLGWLWYLVFLAPSLGVVRSGPWPAMADHYVYLSLPGVFILAAWAVPGRLKKTGRGRISAAVAGSFLLITLSAAAAGHVGHFKNSRVLFTRAAAVTEDNFFAYIGLGNVYQKRGDLRQAARYFRWALAIHPDSAGAHANLGMVLTRLNKTGPARSHLNMALRLAPDFVPARLGLANFYLKTGRSRQAARHYRMVLAADPDNAAANYNLGRLLAAKGEVRRAAACFSRALASRPYDDRLRRAQKAVESRLQIKR